MFTRNDKVGAGLGVGILGFGLVTVMGGFSWLVLAGFFWLAWGDLVVSDLRWWKAGMDGTYLPAPGDDWITTP